jgi:uncharacterized membrane protein YqaE (UPF0057 family)
MRKILLGLVLVLFVIGPGFAAKKDKTKTAEDVYEYASQMTEFTPETKALLKAEMKSLTRKERERLMDMVMEDVEEVMSSKGVQASDNMVALYILAVLLPPVAVGLYTDWQMPTVWNLIFTLLFWLPGIIHAFIVLTR